MIPPPSYPLAAGQQTGEAEEKIYKKKVIEGEEEEEEEEEERARILPQGLLL